MMPSWVLAILVACLPPLLVGTGLGLCGHPIAECLGGAAVQRHLSYGIRLIGAAATMVSSGAVEPSC